MKSCKLMSGILMPQLGLGTWQGSGDEIKSAVTSALEAGYRHIDCAFVYQNEDIVGQAVKEAFQKGTLTRSELFITSKLPQQGHRREKVKHFLELTLKRLGVDYLDLYLIHHPVSTQYVDDVRHWPLDGNGNLLRDDEVDLKETWKGMEDCVDAGMVKDIGLSNFNTKQIQTIWDSARIKPANLQVECHIYFQQEPLVNFCHNMGITVTAYSPLGTGGSPAFFKNRFGKDFTLPATVLDEPLLKKIGDKYNKTAAQVALRFLVQRGIIVIPKSVSASRIQENTKIFDFALEETEMEDLRSLDRGIRILEFNFVPGIVESPKYPW